MSCFCHGNGRFVFPGQSTSADGGAIWLAYQTGAVFIFTSLRSGFTNHPSEPRTLSQLSGFYLSEYGWQTCSPPTPPTTYLPYLMCGLVEHGFARVACPDGREVVKSLHGLGFNARATAVHEKDAEKVPEEAGETVFFEFGKPETFAKAFEGVKKMFLMRPPAISDIETYIKPVIDYAAANGVEQIAFLSLVAMEDRTYVPHYKVEQFMKASGVPYTFLRCGFFMQNLSTTHRIDVVEHDDLFVPVGKAKTAFIDARDIGAVATHVLTTPGHDNQAYDLTGKEALTYYQVADIFTEVLGRKITYSNPSVFKFAWRMKKRGNPWGYVLVTSGLYFATRRGSAEEISDGVQKLLGRDPITMKQFVADNAEVWQK